MTIKPLYDRVLIQREEAEERTASGIIIPDTSKEKPIKGKVIAVGDGAVNDKGETTSLKVKVGDKVLFGKWGGTEVTVDGEELLIMKESDILAIIE